MENQPEDNTTKREGFVEQEKTNQSKQDAALPPPNSPYALAWLFFSLKYVGWILFVITLFLLSIVLFNPSISVKVLELIGITDRPQVSDQSQQDPLRIDGTWTYETNLVTTKNPNGHNGYVAYKGENTIKIVSNNNGYIMTAERTHIRKYGDADFTEIAKQPVYIENIGVNTKDSEIHFTFEVSQEKGRGFAVMKVIPNKARMEGTAYYLFPDGKWDIVKLSFYR